MRVAPTPVALLAAEDARPQSGYMTSAMAPRDKDELDADEAPRHRSTGRFARFARLSGLTAGVAARHLTQRALAAFQSEEEAEEARRRTLEKSASTIAATFGELKGAAMKVGQMLSTDPELLPPEVTSALATLQRDAPPMPFSMVRGVVENALGGALEDHFTSFSEEPIGAASIGQVHRATTREGEDVAVKVQYPGIAESIESDLKNLGALLNLARAKLPKERVNAYLEEITEVLKRESDYLYEADALERFQTVLKDVQGVRAPIPVHELCRRDLLTMEYVEGERLVDWLARQIDEKKRDMGTRLVHAYIEMVHTHGALHADPHPGNFLVDGEGRLVFLDMGCVRDYDLAFSDGLIRILTALWRHDLDALKEAWKALDFRDEGVDPEVVYEWLEIALAPLLVDREWDFASWRVHEQGLEFVKKHPSILGFAPPREAVFYLRVLAGLRGLFAQGGVRVNAYRISREAVKARGLI